MPRLSGKVQTFFYFSPAVEFAIAQEVTGLRLVVLHHHHLLSKKAESLGRLWQL